MTAPRPGVSQARSSAGTGPRLPSNDGNPVQTPAPPEAPASVSDEVFAFPLSFAQQRLWFLDQMEPGTSLYNLPLNLRFSGPLDVATLERALSEVVRRHESLRTVFRTLNEEPRQVVLPPAPVAVTLHDLAALDDAARRAELDLILDAEARRAFDLAAGPLIRATLVRLGDDEHVAAVVMHHIISDGWSLGVLVSELGEIHEAYSRGLPSPLPELAVQYADVAIWQRETLEGDAMDAQLDYWRQELAGAPAALELPTDRPRPAVQSFPGATIRRTLPAELTGRLRALGRGEEATLFMTLLAGFAVVLGRWSGQRDVTVGSPIAGRTHSEMEGLIGFMVNTLVLRARLDGNPTFRELIGRVREATLGAYGNQDVPFERLVDALHPERDMSRPPVFQVMFLLQNQARPGSDRGGVRIEMLPSQTDLAKFDVSLGAVEVPDGMDLVLQYNTDLFDAGTAERFMAHFRAALEAAVADPGARVWRLPILPAEERALMLERWNDTAAPPPRHPSMHGRFAERAALAPDAVALEWEGGRVSYRELDERANRLAHHLRELGVG
ncbi:MAG TPA: condensation domain-containing protein, partial [Longimicrobium sp.]|nr:condensation domain-containing protein [Longimicrobium sp.]